MNRSNANRRILQPMVCTILLAGFLLFTAPMSAIAQTIEWDPLSMNFQNVAYDTTETRTLSLNNVHGTQPLRIENIEWEYLDYYDPPDGPPVQAFDYTTSEPLPAVIPPGEALDVYISFSPIDDGIMSMVMGDLMITNDSTNTPGLFYGLLGMGASDIDADGVSDIESQKYITDVCNLL